jgi:CHAT domain-containing protein
MGTIYPLSDAGSSRLVPELYRLHLREGLSWADALRRAQLHRAGGVASGASQAARQATMSEEELERLEGYLIPASHPYHWAAVTVSGKE